MAPLQVAVVQERTWNTPQARIERLTQEKIRLFKEWRQAINRAYFAPAPYCYDAVHTLVNRYRELVDAVQAHITMLETTLYE